MKSKEYLINDHLGEETTNMVSYLGKTLVYVQVGEGYDTEYDFDDQHYHTVKHEPYVIVPGFKVGGPHPSTSCPHPRAIDVEMIPADMRDAVRQLLASATKGHINFWTETTFKSTEP